MRQALFILTSPFQILNAIEAYYYYNIDNAKYLFVTDNVSMSRDQMIELAHEFAIKYEIIENTNLRLGNIYSLFYLIKHLIFSREIFKYNYTFLGDALENQLNIWCSLRTCYGGKIIYLDDGSTSLNLLNNGVRLRGFFKLLYNIVCSAMKIEKYHMFTSYYRNPTDKFKVVSNNFSIMSKYMGNYQVDDCIYIVGTAVDEFCGYIGIDINLYLVKLDALFSELKRTSSERIVYVPHRRDNNKEVIKLCSKNRIDYEHLDVAIEIFFCKHKKCPKKIYGFGSSALHNLKMLFPKSQITNILLEGSNIKGVNEYKNIGEFYQGEDIELLTL
ncbi:hypothetical protein [uncultured Bacteroides sp.]|uniref:hypothetical protein n=1 Tax=uncultured Bacteroides sp. TaxID=162156 RepID=UPI0025F2B7E5|nr:hypothetical protein [uncultured Bacteroides sp.]